MEKNMRPMVRVRPWTYAPRLTQLIISVDHEREHSNKSAANPTLNEGAQSGADANKLENSELTLVRSSDAAAPSTVALRI